MPEQKIIKFEIVTPEGAVLKEKIAQVSVPTKQGEITVLPGHIPLVASLMPGVIEIIKENGEREIISVSGGFIEVLKEKIVILADTAERAEEIDMDRVEEARKRAEEIKKDSRHFDRERFVNISANIAKELARTKAVKRWKKINTESEIKN
ncbi:ATP synthase F1 subunit epsilon [Candidatus Parcubacteria bacterium]|nr:ATP synthase F1 subunit epsilon [Candidatus Parcubacteria bacterium]